MTPATLEMIATYTQLDPAADRGLPAVRSLIDSELRREIAREEEEHAAAALVAATLPTASGDDLLSAIRVGIGTVQAAGYSPNAVLLNPADYADLDIAVMGATLLGPAIRQNFWGLTPIPANSQPAGTATVGDFRPRRAALLPVADQPVRHRQPRGHVPDQRVHAARRASVARPPSSGRRRWSSARLR